MDDRGGEMGMGICLADDVDRTLDEDVCGKTPGVRRGGETPRFIFFHILDWALSGR